MPARGEKGRRSPRSPRAGERAQPSGGRLSPTSPGLRSPGPASPPPTRVPGLLLRPQLCGDTAAPAPAGSRGHRVPAAAKEGRAAPAPAAQSRRCEPEEEKEERGSKGRSHYQSFVPVLAEGAAENSLDVAKVPVAEVRGADDNVVALHGAGAASSGRARRGWAGRAGAGGAGARAGRGCGPSGAARPREANARRGGRGGAERAAAAAGRHSAIIASSLAGRLH